MRCRMCKYFNANNNFCDKIKLSVGQSDPIYFHDGCEFRVPYRDLCDDGKNSGYNDMVIEYDRLLEEYYKLKSENKKLKKKIKEMNIWK